MIGEIISHLIEFLIDEGIELLTTKAESPVSILITAPNGLRVGYDSVTDSVINEIEGSMYSGLGKELQLIVIPSPLRGDYIIDVFGTGTGRYTITVESIATDGTVIGTLILDGVASQGKLDTYSIGLKEDYSVVQQSQEPFPIWIVAVTVIIAIVGTSLAVYLTKFKKTTEKAM